MEDSNWRTQLPQGSRLKVIKKLMDKLIKHTRPPGPQEVSRVESVALRFEEKVFTTATSKADYVNKISSKLESIDKAAKQEQLKFSSSSAANIIENSVKQAFHRPLPQFNDQGRSLSNSSGAHPQSHKHLSLQGAQNCIASSMVQSSTDSTSPMQVQGREDVLQFVPQPDQHHVRNAPSQQSIMQASSVMLPSELQSPSVHGLQQNQQPSIKISIQSGPQQHLQSVSMRQQQPKPITVHQQRTTKLQQPTMLPKQLQHLPNATRTHNQLNDQQNTVPNMQYQQQLLGQNSHSSINVHQFGLQSNVSRSRGQSGNSSMHNDQQNSMWPQVCVEHQIQQMGSDFPESQGQPTQSQPSNQQMMSQLHVKSAKLQPQTAASRQDMLQRIQESGSLLQPQHQFEEQNQSSESQSAFPVVSSMEVDCKSQTRVFDGDSWKEDVYQKIEMMKDILLPDLKEIYQRLTTEFLQFHSKSPHQKIAADYEKLNAIKALWERVFAFLHLRKSEMSQDVARKLGEYDKMIYLLLQYIGSKSPISSLQQGQLTPSVVRSLQQPLQSRPQNPRLHSNANQINPHLESMDLDHPVTAKGKNKVTTLRDGLAIPSGLTTAPQIKLNSQQPDTNFDSPQGNDVKLRVQKPANSRIYSSSLKSGVNVPQRKINHLMLQNMHLKQQNEQRMMQDQPAEQQLQQCQATKKAFQRGEDIELQLPWQPSKFTEHKSPQLHQINEVTSLKGGQALGVKTGSFMRQNSAGQLLGNNRQLVNSDSPPSISSSQLQDASPQIYQHTSQQIDPKTLETYFTKSGTCSQSVALSHSISLAPSPVKEDSNEITLLENSGNGLQDGSQNNVSASEFFESGVTREPIQRLMKVVGSMSHKALSASVRDMESVVSMIDRTAGSIQGSGSTFGDEWMPMSDFCLLGENMDSHPKTMKIRRFVRAKPSNIVQSADGMTNGFKELTDPETCDMEADATSHDKRPRAKVNDALFKEIKEINQRLIGTVVDIIDASVDSTTTVSITEAGEGTIVRCSFNAVAICPDMKSELGSAPVSNILPLRLLVPTNYPNCSPVLLDKLPQVVSRRKEDLSAKVMSKLHASLQNLVQPVSLREIARNWDACARAVVTEYACQNGGGSFSTTYGTWENNLSVA